MLSETEMGEYKFTQSVLALSWMKLILYSNSDMLILRCSQMNAKLLMPCGGTKKSGEFCHVGATSVSSECRWSNFRSRSLLSEMRDTLMRKSASFALELVGRSFIVCAGGDGDNKSDQSYCRG
jgi:hypothetical protein